jgi:hypothetical protein
VYFYFLNKMIFWLVWNMWLNGKDEAYGIQMLVFRIASSASGETHGKCEISMNAANRHLTWFWYVCIQSTRYIHDYLDRLAYLYSHLGSCNFFIFLGGAGGGAVLCPYSHFTPDSNDQPRYGLFDDVMK